MSIPKSKQICLYFVPVDTNYLVDFKLTLLCKSFCHISFPSSYGVHAGDYCRGGVFYARNFRRIRKNQIPPSYMGRVYYMPELKTITSGGLNS